MRPSKKRRRFRFLRRLQTLETPNPTNSYRLLRFQQLESRQLLAADFGVAPLADITGLWVSVGDREYYSSELASVTVDMYSGETLKVSGIQYGLDATYTPQDGVIAFESYVRREHGAAEIGSYDYTDGRFGDPVAEPPLAGEIVTHPGNDSGWQLDVIDNRVAVIAIRYFGDESAVEDRMFIDVNVVQPPEATSWTAAIAPVYGQWQVVEDELGGNSVDNVAGLTVIETGSANSQRFEVGVKVKTVEENAYANGFVVVDYQNENDFVYAGLRSTDNQWVIGHFDGSFHDLASLNQDVQPRHTYDLRVAVDGSHVALAADGVFRVSHDFDRSLDQGAIGLANQYAFTHFTDFHVFDNSAGLITAATPQQVFEEAQIAAAQAQQASESAMDAANQAAAISIEADTHASSLESASSEAGTTATNAAADHAEAVQALADAEQLIAQSEATIQSATNDSNAASTNIDALTVAVADAEQAANTLSQEDAAARQTVNELTEPYLILQQAADEAVSASDAAAVAATAAREASDEAAKYADELRQAPKSIRRAAERAAREADKFADAAEKNSQDAAETAAIAIQEFQAVEAQFQSAQLVAEQTAVALADAQDLLLTTTASLDGAINAFNAATQTILQTEVARDAAVQQLPMLRQQVSQSAELVTRTSEAAELAWQEATTARAAADLAADEAETNRVEALRLAQQAEIANQALSAAALALQQELARQEAITAEQAAATPSDTLPVYAVNFNHQDDGAFDTVAGSSERVAGQLHLAPGQDGLAVSVLDPSALPQRTATRVYATVRADALPEFDQNGFIVFDYQSPEDFKYAGAWAGTDRWAIGEVISGQLVDRSTLDELIGQGPAYDLQVWIQDSTLTLLVEGQQKVQHTFEQPIDDGQIGVASYNARSRFDQVAVMQLYGGAGDIGVESAATDPAATDAAINALF